MAISRYINDRGGVPLCMHCLQPHDPLVHYCPHCGGAVGQLTPNIPFVNIRFGMEFWSNLWQRLWASDTHPMMRVMCILLVMLAAPIMLLGLPFVLLKARRKQPRGFDVLVDTEKRLAENDTTKK